MKLFRLSPLLLFFFLLVAGCGGGNDSHQGSAGNDDPEAGGIGQVLWDFETEGVPKFLKTNHLDLRHVQRISRFRSSAGHDYSDHFECERSMKHYFHPREETDEFQWPDIEIVAPVTGTIVEVMDEWGGGIGGCQLWIEPDDYPAFHVIIFHVGLAQPLERGDRVEEGQVLGHHATGSTWNDLAVAVWTECPPEGRDCAPTGHHFDTCTDYAVRNISVFDIMTDELFESYRAFPGIDSRDDLVIPRQERDLYPDFHGYPEELSWATLVEPPANDPGDFTPAVGADPSQAGDGPWSRRLRLATSPDGTDWTRTGLTLADQGDVPSVIVKDGTLWAFYVMWKDADDTEELRNTTVAATSEDLVNWTYRELNFSGLPAGRTPNPVDPAVVASGGGGYRMYFTLGDLSGGPAQTYSAVSANLLDWTVEGGPRYPAAGSDVLDPNLLWVGDHFEFFAGGAPGANHHAASTGGAQQHSHGLAFQPLADFVPDPFVVMANGLKIGGEYRYYGFTQEPGSSEETIRSFTYAGDGQWTLDPGIRLAVDEAGGEERTFVTDPAVAPHPAGSDRGYVMVYVTEVP
ncbi:hypothetical protein [uncultured Desulfuromonas sp.]|uniref:hypothetical protein n=1 Tax=uncultured Desulfuromonas sp. TaxID=181013 RepID=UPI002628A32C|nr:hypothetical protein [uncultured Desulfuromonas sp.]